jgi:hypothetical protein
MDTLIAPFRRFWFAYVDALERYLDRKDPPAEKRNTERINPAQIEKIKKEKGNEN